MTKTILSVGTMILFTPIFNDFNCNTDKDVIVWADNKKLEWTDFQSVSPENSNPLAEVSVRLKLDYLYLDSLNFDVLCIMEKKKSWVLDQSGYTLNHEQGHFDIGEVYARMLRKAIIETKRMLNSSSIKRLDSMYYYYGEKMLLEQKLYDKETTFPRLNREMQLFWKEYIKERLDSLSEFARNNSMRIKWEKKMKTH